MALLSLLANQYPALAQLPETDHCGPANVDVSASRGDEFTIHERRDICPIAGSSQNLCSSPLVDSSEIQEGIAKWEDACPGIGTTNPGTIPRTSIEIGADVSEPTRIGIRLEIIQGQRLINGIARTPGDFAPDRKAIEIAPSEYDYIMTGGKLRIWTRDENDNPTDIADTFAHELGHAYGLDHPASSGAMQQCSTARRIMAQRPDFGSRSVGQKDCNQANRRWLTDHPDDVSDPVPRPIPPFQPPFPPGIDPCDFSPFMMGCGNGPFGTPIWRVCELIPGGTVTTDSCVDLEENGQICTQALSIEGSHATRGGGIQVWDSEWRCTTVGTSGDDRNLASPSDGGPGPNIMLVSPFENEIASGMFPIAGAVAHSDLSGETIGIFVDDQPVSLVGFDDGLGVSGFCDTPSGQDPRCPNIGFAGYLDTTSLRNGEHRLQVMAIDYRWPNPRLTWAERPFVVDNSTPPPAEPDIALFRQWDSQPAPDGGQYDFGPRDLGQLPVVATFLVCNLGDGPLTISNLASIVSGDGFTKGTGPHPPIAAGGCSQLPVRFETATPGSYVGEVVIESNDPDEARYTFSLSGEATGFIDTTPPRVFIGRPLTNEVISGTFEVRGWAIDATLLSTSSLSFEIDGLPISLGGFAYGSYRQGACTANADLNSPNCPDVGWEGMLHSTTLGNGLHEITLRGVDSSGNSRERTIPFTVDNPPLPPSNSLWALDVNDNQQWDGEPPDRNGYFDLGGGTAVAGDWNGDGLTDMGAFDAGQWRLDTNGNGLWDGCAIDGCASFGLAGDHPVVGDWNGDGRDKIGIFRAGNWSLDANGNRSWDGPPIDLDFAYGFSTALPVAGDWNGDGISDVGTYSDGSWHLDDGDGLFETCGFDTCGSFGLAGDHPISGDWNGDGQHEVGVKRGSHWSLDANGNLAWDGTAVDLDFDYGLSNDDGISGDWNGDGLESIGAAREP